MGDETVPGGAEEEVEVAGVRGLARALEGGPRSAVDVRHVPVPRDVADGLAVPREHQRRQVVEDHVANGHVADHGKVRSVIGEQVFIPEVVLRVVGEVAQPDALRHRTAGCHAADRQRPHGQRPDQTVVLRRSCRRSSREPQSAGGTLRSSDHLSDHL
jgi:hypothetical protein